MGGESPIGYIAIYSPPYREGPGAGLFLYREGQGEGLGWRGLLTIGSDNIAINKLL